MVTCRRCNGEGYETYEEDGRQVRDACYHCATSGKVDEETDFRDRLISAAEFLGRLDEQEYRHACNDDPNGDGYDLIAAEHGMMAGDYFRSRVWDRGFEIAVKVADLPIPDQEMLLAIYEGWSPDPWVENVPAVLPSSTFASRLERLEAEEDDEIPF